MEAPVPQKNKIKGHLKYEPHFAIFFLIFKRYEVVVHVKQLKMSLKKLIRASKLKFESEFGLVNPKGIAEDRHLKKLARIIKSTRKMQKLEMNCKE